MPIYPKDYYAQVGPNGFGVKSICTGPYKVAEVEPGKKIVLEAFDKYFAGSPKGKPAIKRIVWRTISEVNTKLAELMTGGLDWCWLIPPDQATKLAQVPNIKVVESETMRVGFLGMDAANVSKDAFSDNPFTKLKVRQAMNYAIDAATMSKTLAGGQSKPVDSVCFPTQFGCTGDVTKYSYDPVQAKKLLAEAGYPNGFEVDFNVYRHRPWTPTPSSATWPRSASRPSWSNSNTPPCAKSSRGAKSSSASGPGAPTPSTTSALLSIIGSCTPPTISPATPRCSTFNGRQR